MAFDKIPRPSSGSGKVEIIDGIEFPGLGSGGFGPNDFLFIGSDGDDFDLIGGLMPELFNSRERMIWPSVM